MRVDEVNEKVDAKIDVKALYLIDWIVSYIATRSTFIPCLRELQSGTTRIIILK